MRDLGWSDVREWFDPDDGVLHDGCVVGSVSGAWAAVAGLVRARGWRSAGPEPCVATLQVWPADGFLVNFFESAGDEVLFDVEGLDPSEEPYLHYDPVVDGFVLDQG
ncbi:hypothetical protein [Lentzea sp. CA-135723]|uniref:hypothetical protein n=1 Tax=Lentzea sp. CA-135723 TaxID=3239950 RepID=UPI003D8D32F1